MIQQHLKNPFDGRVSEDNFKKIAQTHIERLKTNNQDGTFTKLIDSTEPKFNAYEQSITDEAIEKSVKEGKTISTNDSIRLLKSFVLRKEGVIADKFAPGTASYEEFFPRGTKEYTRASKKNIEVLFKRFISACNNHTTDFGKELNDFFDFSFIRRKKGDPVPGVDPPPPPAS